MKKWIGVIFIALPMFVFSQGPDDGDTNTKQGGTSFESYSKYDFVPGEDIVYAEDFSQDVIGEFPLLWATDNRGEVVNIKGQDGRWLRMFHKSHFASPLLKELPENFTTEFDMIIHFKEQGYVYPNINLRLVGSPKSDKDGNGYINDPFRDPMFEIILNPGDEGSSTIMVNSQKDGQEYFRNDQKGFTKLSDYFGKPFHVAMWVQKQRLRVWINGEKIYDIPKAIPPGLIFNRLAFEVANCFYEEEQVGVYVSNIRIAQGAPDIRNKLLNEGKLVTHGILFDVNSDRIRDESFGVLKEIAAVLNDNTSLELVITGFTDSDGDEQKNLDLSKRRAVAVKRILSEHFKIAGERLKTDGKGEAYPIADNKTKEGKAKNRRVEFARP